MAKIAILVPREYMREQAEKLLEKQPQLKEEILEVKVIKTEDAVKEARRVIDEGAHIIVARGLQAKIMREFTRVPIVDIVITTQELGLMIKKAVELVKKQHPKIYMVTLKNAIGDTAYVDQIFDVEFHACCAENIEELEQMVDDAVKDGADVIIGGDKVERIVKRYHIPSIFSIATEDSIRNALEIAQKMSYSADVERQFNAQVESILDTTFSGVIRIDREQMIQKINRMTEELLQKKEKDVLGKNVNQVLSLDDDYVERVLSGRQESCLTSAKIRETPVMVMIAPIRYDDAITGAILSWHRLKNVNNVRTRTVPEMYLSGYIAKGDFDRFYSQDKQMRQTIELAKKYALSRFPVLIYGEDDAETSLFAQSIHNNSLRKNSPFVSANCANLTEEQQFQMLFGENSAAEGSARPGVLETAKYGTVFIREIDKMGSVCQYQLFKMINSQGFLLSDADRTPRYDVRLIATAGRELETLVKEGMFRRDLYYALNALCLRVPSLRTRPEDIIYLVKQYLSKFKENYSRHLFLTADAMEQLVNFSWDGGVVQLEAFCERLFLTASRKNIDGAAVSALLKELYPTWSTADQEEKAGSYMQPEAEELLNLLRKHGGRRGPAAEELGISTTTLWRRMKKFGIAD